MSYSDMMAGLLLVFVLLLIGVVAANLMQSEANLMQIKAHLERQRAVTEQNEQLRQSLTGLHTDVKNLLSVRDRLKSRLGERFGNNKISGVEFDPETGAVRLGTSVLFAHNSAVLAGAGQDKLQAVLPDYVEALLGDADLRDSVDQIVFEGHTNSIHAMPNEEAGYLFNLRLSQERAYAALEFVMSDAAIRPYIKRYKAERYLTAVGHSSSHILCAKDDQDNTPVRCDKLKGEQRELKAVSRRLEIRFRLKDEDAMKRLDERLGAEGR